MFSTRRENPVPKPPRLDTLTPSMRAKPTKALVRKPGTKPPQSAAPALPRVLLTDVRELILAARQTVARGVNAALVMLYWKIGQRIRQDVLRERRAEYGEEILPTLSAKLVPDFGQGFGVRNLARMISFAQAFPDERIVATLSKECKR